MFTDGHPIVEPRSFFNHLAHIGEVDLNLTGEKLWFDTDAYPDRKRRRQAEFLVWERMPLDLVRCFVVMTDGKHSQLQQLLQSRGVNIPCIVRRGWYY